MRHVRPIPIEVCVDQVSDALQAIESGASRIEMNCALELDGLTPAASSCRWLKENSSVPVIAMLRPHNRDFFYSPGEQDAMLRECKHLLDAGVDGIVTGGLTEHRQVDQDFLSRVVSLCDGREVIFHRAFDLVSHPTFSLQHLIDCGVTRVLTSGGAPTAEEGIPVLKELVEIAESRIEILPGGGVTRHNAERILRGTGARQLHGSFRRRSNASEPKRINGLNTEELHAVCEIIRGLESLECHD